MHMLRHTGGSRTAMAIPPHPWIRWRVIQLETNSVIHHARLVGKYVLIGYIIFSRHAYKSALSL